MTNGKTKNKDPFTHNFVSVIHSLRSLITSLVLFIHSVHS